MQVNDHLEAVFGCPSNSFLEVRQLSMNIVLAGTNFKSPVADGYPHMVQTVINMLNVGKNSVWAV